MSKVMPRDAFSLSNKLGASFQLQVPFEPNGDQPQAIKKLVEGLRAEQTAQTLLGVTGSGKTYTMANVIAQVNRPTLLISHNKTLAAQLYNEMKEFFPNNHVEYFISYYDYYQPEAYIPRTDTFIEKTATINDEIDRLRHAATRNLFEFRDVIVVASVSCIYGLGLPENYFQASIPIMVGDVIDYQELLHSLVRIQYRRAEGILERATFRVRGDVLDIQPAHEERMLRIAFFGDEVESITILDPATSEVLETIDSTVIYPAMHYVANRDDLERAIQQIQVDLQEQIQFFMSIGKDIEAKRIEQRTLRDIDMMRELGYCTGIENYSRILENRASGTPPKALLDYFASDYLLIIDESHVTIPQLRGMYHGDRSRKETLVQYGFRLPCAKDNRPLNFEEFIERIGQRIYVSATPSKYELEESVQVVEQVIRPTGLLDPEVIIQPTEHQVDHLFDQIQQRVAKDERVLITTLTKRMAEDLTDYFQSMGIRVRYLHSDIKSLERIEIIRDLRLGNFDVLIGVNLLREGLDLPEVTLVAIMDADKEGFLRSESSLIQTIGRAARNAAGVVILYADKVTNSMERAMEETRRRREKQKAYNETHGITPVTIKKEIHYGLLDVINANRADEENHKKGMSKHSEVEPEVIPPEQLPMLIEELEAEMHRAAKLLEFEKAAKLRDQLTTLKRL